MVGKVFKHPTYGSMVSFGSGKEIEGVPQVKEADAISFLMQEWQEVVKAEGIDFYSYVIEFYVMDHPLAESRIGYRAGHKEDLINNILIKSP